MPRLQTSVAPNGCGSDSDLLAGTRTSRGPNAGWELIAEPDVVVPDLAGWTRDRMTSPPTGSRFELVPDWICEVISPSTARIDRVIKRAIYGRRGVAHLWLVDPLSRTLKVFALESGRWAFVGAYADEAVVRAAPFDAVAIDLLRWWGETRE